MLGLLSDSKDDTAVAEAVPSHTLPARLAARE